MKILTVCLNPVIQKTLEVRDFKENSINRTETYFTDISGKGVNVSRCLSQLGCSVTHLTHLGGIHKEQFLSIASMENLELDWVESESEIRYCYTLLNDRIHSVTEIVEEAREVNLKTEYMVRDRFSRIADSYDYIIFTGSKARGYSDEIFPDLVKESKELGKTVLLDLRGPDLIRSLEYAPDFIKPNYDEFCETFSLNEGVEEKMLETAEKYNTTVILTNETEDTLWTEYDSIKKTPILQTTQAVNTTGCGDAFTAGFSRGILLGEHLKEAVCMGHEAARANAENIRPGRIREVVWKPYKKRLS